MSEEYIIKAEHIAKETATLAKKTGRISIFSIASTANINNPSVIFPSIRETDRTVAGNSIVSSVEQAGKIAQAVDGVVDIILIDVEKKVEGLDGLETVVRSTVKKSGTETFKPNDMTADACDAIIAKLCGTLEGKKAAVIGSGNVGSKVALKLAERGAQVTISRPDTDNLKKLADGLNVINEKRGCLISYDDDNLQASKDADILIGFTPGIPVIDEAIISAIKPTAIIIDGGIGTIKKSALELASDSGRKVFCLDMRAGYSGAISTILDTETFIKDIMGSETIETQEGLIRIVAGGIIGNSGDVVVDRIKNPSRIVGIADGKGDLIHDAGIDNSLLKKIGFLKKRLDLK